MYGCLKKDDPDEQKKCSYHKDATKTNRCMFLKFDEFCDCLDAIQKKKETPTKDS
jgi:hypothetical protein